MRARIVDPGEDIANQFNTNETSLTTQQDRNAHFEMQPKFEVLQIVFVLKRH